MLSRGVSPPRSQKLSTTELKQALQKIKQTQLEVLKVLRTEGQNTNINDLNIRALNQNIDSNMPYIKSIAHINLLKMAEINNMRKQIDREKERANDKISALNNRIHLLEEELQLKQRSEQQWIREKMFLNDQLNILKTKSQSNGEVKSEDVIKMQVSSYQEQLSQKIRERMNLEQRVSSLQQELKLSNQDKQKWKSQVQTISKQLMAEKDKNRFEADIKLSQMVEKKRLPYEDIFQQIRKISGCHQKLYQSFKTRTRLSISDLDQEEEIHKCFSKLLGFIEVHQRMSLDEKKSIEDDDSMIQGFKAYDSESFRDQVKKFQKQLFQSENIKKELSDLKNQIAIIKQSKNILEGELIKCKEKLTESQFKLKTVADSKASVELQRYNELAAQLETEMKRIREEKTNLTILVKKITENSMKASSDEEGMKTIRDQLAQIIDLNQHLRSQNQNLRKMIDGLNIQSQGLKFERMRFENSISQKHTLIERQVREKEYLIADLKKLQNIIRQKDVALFKQQKKIQELNQTIKDSSKKNENDLQMKSNEITGLRHQIQKLMKEMRELREIAYKYQLLQIQTITLRKKLIQVNSTVIHLWQIKQTQYQNISRVLAETNSI